MLVAQATMKPGHERVPPFRDPSPYMSAADIQAGLNKLDPKLVSSRTGGAIPFAEGKAPGVVRRRMSGPQYAITHTRSLEYMMVTKGTATLVTGGTLDSADDRQRSVSERRIRARSSEARSA